MGFYRTYFGLVSYCHSLHMLKTKHAIQVAYLVEDPLQLTF